MSKKKLLSEYEAAAMVGMSPTLLRWFTKYAPKSADSRKLKIAKTKQDMIFFEYQELLSFNEWLRLPWPHKPGRRTESGADEPSGGSCTGAGITRKTFF